MAGPAQIHVATGGCRRIAAPVALLSGLLLLVVVGLGIYVAFNFQSVSANFVSSMLVQSVNQSAAPSKQKERMTAKINQVRDRFEAKQITYAQIKAVSKRVFSDASIRAGLFYFAAKQAVDDSALESAKQVRLRRLLRRFVHGVDTGTVEPKRIADLAPLVSNQGRPKDEVPLTDLQKLGERLERAVSAVPREEAPQEIDVADRFDRTVDQAMARASDEGR